MSGRNTGLFLPGHVSAESLGDLLREVPGLDMAAFQGDEALRVGHGQRDGRSYTHVGLRLFEEGGLLLMDQLALPEDDDIEIFLGCALSSAYREAVYLFYDEERGAGGHALFKEGALVSRRVVDGREFDPLMRELSQESPLEDLDPSEWIWPLAAQLVEEGAKGVLGAGVCNDDDIASLIEEAGGIEVRTGPPPAVEPVSQVRARDPMRAGRLRGLLFRIRNRGE